MENSEKEISKKRLSIKEWLKDKNNILILGVFISVIIIRFYYFWITKSQPLWWDEAEYMSVAKDFAGIMDFPYHFALNRFPGFSLLASVFYMIGINNEIILRFFLAFIPSLIVIFLIYLIMKEMYSDKKIAIISVAILTLLWEHVFYSNRFHTENFSLIFGFLAIFVLFRVYIKKQNFYFIKPNNVIIYILILSILCILFRSGNMMFLPLILLFLLVVNFYRFPKRVKTILIILVISALILFLFTIDPLAQKYPSINLFYHYEMPIAWNDFSVFYGFYQSLVQHIPSVLFYAFLLGIILFFIKITIAPELLKRLSLNSEDIEIKSDIFNTILISAVLFFFVFMFRQNGFEYRWFFIFLPGMLAFTSKGIINFSEYLASFISTKNMKKLAAIFILIIMIFGLYTEWYHADMIVKYKITSYAEVKDSALWIKENSNKNDLIMTASTMQQAYYSERRVANFDQFNNVTSFEKYIKQNNPKYIVMSVFQQHPDWVYSFPEEHKDEFKPVKVYADQEKQQPILIVYAYNSQNSS